jgi:tetratricopeptide (TPR) repeat protein
MMHAQTMPPDDAAKLDSACASAMQLQLAGQLDLAGQLYGAILKAAPGHPAANYGLGILHVQSQRAADGLPYLKAALQARLDVVDYWLGYLEALTLAGQTEAARNILALGLRQGIAGKAVDEFAERLRTLPTERPPTPPVAAATHKKRAKRPRNERDIRKLESTLLSLVERHDNPAALELARDLTEWCPKRGFGWKILGAFMPTDDGYDSAIEVMRTAVRLLPNDAEAHVNLGITLAKIKCYQEAEGHLHHALRINPRLPAAHFRLAMIYEYQGLYADSEASLRRGRSFGIQSNAVAGDDELSYSHILFLMGHNPSIDADEFFAENCRYGEYIEGKLRPSWPTHRNDRTPDRSLKVGFVSGDFRNHSVANFLEPVLEQLKSRPGLELYGYYSNTLFDTTTRRIQARLRNWQPVAMLSDERLAGQIMEDSIDILIDLSGHTGSNRLPVFARKPAPVQVSWLGYPATTGAASHGLLPRRSAVATTWEVRLAIHRKSGLFTGSMGIRTASRLSGGRASAGAANRSPDVWQLSPARKNQSSHHSFVVAALARIAANPNGAGGNPRRQGARFPAAGLRRTGHRPRPLDAARSHVDGRLSRLSQPSGHRSRYSALWRCDDDHAFAVDGSAHIDHRWRDLDVSSLHRHSE